MGLNDIAQSVPGLSALRGAPKPTKEEVSLAVNGKKFEGWESVSVRSSIKAIAGSFQLSLVDKWAQDQVPWRVVPGDECILTVGKDTLITGYIDGVKPAFDRDNRSLFISGRDQTADLVDCSAIHKPGNWANLSLLKLANILGDPFGISASTELSVALVPFPNVCIQGSETAFECLERHARLKGALLMNDGDGDILITRAGTSRAATNLEQGVNILSASADYEAKERFSKYIVKGQAQGLGDSTPEFDLQASGIAYDPAIVRFRPLLVIAEGAATPDICKSRAQWEATVRAAKSSPLTIVVQGWRQSDGKLWTLNQITKVKSSWLGVNQEFLISSVEFKKGNEGTTTTLELERPDAYTPDPTLSTRKEPWRQIVIQESARR